MQSNSTRSRLLRQCLECLVDISERGHSATRCSPCQAVRRNDLQRKRVGYRAKPLCVDCKIPIVRKRAGFVAPRRCENCRREHERRYVRERMRRRIGYRLDPVCLDCAEPVSRIAGARPPERCEDCQQKRKRRLMRRRQGYIENPICLDCGKPTTRLPGRRARKRCEECRRRAAAQAKTARNKRLGGPTPRRYVKALVFRQLGTCGICHRDLPGNLGAIHVDHIIPVSKGGTNAWENLQAAHAHCNMSKQARI